MRLLRRGPSICQEGSGSYQLSLRFFGLMFFFVLIAWGILIGNGYLQGDRSGWDLCSDGYEKLSVDCQEN